MDEVVGFGMIFSVVMVALIGGFILMYPITRRLGAYLEKRIEEGGGKKLDPESLQSVHHALDDLRDQIHDLRERQEFMEKLVEGRDERGALSPPGGAADPSGG